MLNSLAQTINNCKIKWPDLGKEEEKKSLTRTESHKDLIN